LFRSGRGRLLLLFSLFFLVKLLDRLRFFFHCRGFLLGFTLSVAFLILLLLALELDLSVDLKLFVSLGPEVYPSLDGCCHIQKKSEIIL
jgi:hypothetical protein